MKFLKHNFNLIRKNIHNKTIVIKEIYFDKMKKVSAILNISNDNKDLKNNNTILFF